MRFLEAGIFLEDLPSSRYVYESIYAIICLRYSHYSLQISFHLQGNAEVNFHTCFTKVKIRHTPGLHAMLDEQHLERSLNEDTPFDMWLKDILTDVVTFNSA